MASSSFSAKLCFNSNCKQVLEQSRKGWRRRTGEYADLCDRCASAYEEGKFCESFHLNASGWRGCESCGKQIHCGCIVSFHMFVLLDAGGIECITCTKKSFILTPNPAWPPPSLVLPGLPDRIKDISVKNWSSIAASGPVPWRQAPSLFNSEMHPKMPFELDIPGGIDRLLISERLSASSLGKKKNEDSSERLINASLKTGASQIFEKGIKCEEQPYPFVNGTQQSAFGNNEPSTPHFSLILNPALKTETEKTKVSKTHAQQPTPPPAAGKQLCSSNGVDSSGEPQTRNGRPRGDAQGRNQLLPRYWPRITDQELQQISGDSNSIITPLFEKMLSASDAGRIGRLVLPKKCAEAYFPPISNPEGIPLMVQDLEGKEWVFQFRFWPNNNSRMYVLEGVTPCIQSMQMQAGDRVTFSRLEPEGKLVMGCRKAFTPSEQCKELINTSNGGSMHGDAIIKATKAGEVVSAYRHSKGNPAASSLSAINQANSADPAASPWLKIDKSNYIAREALGPKPVLRSKRKHSTLASKSKRLRIENEMIELKVTWEQAQGLFRPPPNDVPKIVMIEGYEIEEFEEPPIIGRPTILAEDHVGEKIQWAQCDDCFKWRKVPGDVLFPSRWTCSKNLWDPERSLCSAAQELSPEELKDLLSTSNQAGANKKIEADNEELDSLEALEGLDALAYLAIQEEGDALPSSSLATTKHPRHRPGCSCIVCIQPPSGKGPKHKPTCTCNVCLTVKRRFQTLTLRREKKQSEKEAETARQKLQQPEQLADEKIQPCSDTGNSSPSYKMVINESPVDDPINMKSSASPFKGQIDLNIQPERDEDLSPVSDSGDIQRVLQYAVERYFDKVEKFPSSAGNTTSAGSQMHPSGVGVGNFSNVIPLDSSKNGDSDHPLALPATKI